MNTQQIKYALGKQLVKNEKLCISTDYGNIEIEGEIAEKVAKSIRQILQDIPQPTPKEQIRNMIDRLNSEKIKLQAI